MDFGRFAVETTGKGEELIIALKKLSTDTLANLTPHRLKIFFYYSHPPVLARIQAIKALILPPAALPGAKLLKKFDQNFL